MKKYFKILISLIGAFILIVVISVVFAEYSASYGMGNRIITASPFYVYVFLTRWQVKSGRAFNHLEFVKSKSAIKEEIRLFSYLPVFTVNNYSVGDGLWPSYGYASVTLNENLLNNLSDEALRGVLAHELGHFARGHLSDSRMDGKESELMELQNEADEWAVGIVGKNAVVAYHKEMNRIGRRVSNLAAQ